MEYRTEYVPVGTLKNEITTIVISAATVQCSHKHDGVAQYMAPQSHPECTLDRPLSESDIHRENQDKEGYSHG